MNAMEICVLRAENVLSTQEINVKRDILESIVRIWVGKPSSIFYFGDEIFASFSRSCRKNSAAVV